MPAPPLSLAEAKRRVHAVERALRQGHPPQGVSVNARNGGRTALRVAAQACGVAEGSRHNWIAAAERVYRKVDWSAWQAPAAPADAEITAAPEPLSAAMRLRDQLGLARRERDDLARQLVKAEDVAHALGLVAAQPVEPPDWTDLMPPEPDSAPGVPMLLISDLHVGERVDPAQVNGVNAYDLEVAERRLARVTGKAIDLIRLRSAGTMPRRAVVMMGGDLVSGWLHEELQKTDVCTPLEAVNWCVGRLVGMFDRLLDTGMHVSALWVAGNHGRLSKRPPAKLSAAERFDWLIAQMVARHYQGQDRIRHYIPSSNEALFAVYGHRYLLMHGDELGVKGGDGFIGAIGPIMRGEAKAARSAAQVGRDFDTLVMGHYHTPLWLPRAIVNNALVGFNEYARAQRFGFHRPSQWLWFTHPSLGRISPDEVFAEPAEARSRVVFAVGEAA
jgi:predicted phosphodiesterase